MNEIQRQRDGKKKYGPNYIGNVIRILDNRTIIVNTGKGVLEPNQIIQIYEVGDPLFDIDGEKICNYEYVKDELEVIFVHPLYSICRKFETKVTPNAIIANPLFTSKKEYIPLKVKEEDIKPFKPQNTYIKIGDPIKLA